MNRLNGVLRVFNSLKSNFFRRVQAIFAAVLGRLDWTPPGWVQVGKNRAARSLQALAVSRAARPSRFWGAAAAAGLLLLLLGGGCRWMLKQPSVFRYEITGNSLAPTSLSKDAKPDPLRLHFSGSVAKLVDIKKPVKTGVTLSPPLLGEWVWTSERELVFTPAADWPVGQHFTASFERSLFPPQILLKSYRYEFDSPAFTAQLISSEFYQDPKDPHLKRAEATFSFSHPVAPEAFERLLHLTLRDQQAGLFKTGDAVPFTVSWDEFHGEAYVHSDILQVPPEERSLEVRLDAGLTAARGGPGVKAELKGFVAVPGIYSYFRIGSTELSFVRNADYEPEQVLVVNLSNGVQESVMRGALDVWMLPTERPAHDGDEAEKDYDWRSAPKITEADLRHAVHVKLDPLPTDRDYSQLHSFRYTAPSGRHLYLRLKKGLESYGGYKLADDYASVMRVPPPVREMNIMADGALLSLSGEKKLTVLSRDVPAMHFEVARILPGKINHFVSQASGSFKTPRFNQGFGPDDMSERSEEVRDILSSGQGKTQYTAFDFSSYMGSGKLGLFMFRAEAWDRKNERPLPAGSVDEGARAQGDSEGENNNNNEGGSSDESESENDSGGYVPPGGQLSDQRLILVTNLGLLDKRNADQSHDLFVMNINDGTPAAGVGLEILGRNGVPLFTRVSDGAGRAQFPSLKDYGREKAPTVFVARRGEDVSFLPYGHRDRQLNFSRWETGGIEGVPGEGGLNAYLFSDRGIYRPGDEIRAAMIVKTQDWRRPLGNVPLEIAITNPRGQEVFKQPRRLSASGFEEIKYTPDETAPTGDYEINAHLIDKNGQRGGLLGSTQVKVEEFLPDRMRISARLDPEHGDGWVAPKGVKTRVSLSNLTGIPAENRRLTGALAVTPAQPAFSRWKDYIFRPKVKSEQHLDSKLDDQKTDAKGEGVFALPLDSLDTGFYRLSFAAEGFEAEGGRAVTATTGTLVSALPHLVGYKADGALNYLNKGSAHVVTLTAIDPALKPITLPVTAALIETRFVSVLVRQKNGTYKYESVKKEILHGEAPLSIAAAGVKYPLDTREPGDFTVQLRDSDGVIINEIDYSVAGAANLAGRLDKNAELEIHLSKQDYAPGEEIEVSVKGPYTGSGLITIERDHVIAAAWFKTATTSSVQKIRLPEGVEGNAYINVAFVRAMGSPEIFISPLSYGVAPFSISRASRTLTVTLGAEATVRPGDTLKLRYATSLPSRIVVYGADEGILQVARYRAPDPLSYFFQKRALEVSTSQILDLILPEFKLLRRRSAAGGDEGLAALGKNLNPFKRKRDKPAVCWSGILDAGPETKETECLIPDTFNGNLKLFAVAVAPGALGVAQRATLVRGDFIIQPNLPTFVAPGDVFDVTAAIANNVHGSGDKAKVAVTLAVSEHIEIVEGAQQALVIPEGHEAVARVKVRARELLGSGAFTFTAKMGDKHSSLRTDLSVRPPLPYRTVLTSGFSRDGKAEIPTPRAAEMYPDYRVLEASASPLPLNLAHGLVQYLNRFPYGCTEQITSQAFPAIVLRDRPEFGGDAAAAEQNLQKVIRMLRARQRSEGGFNYWPDGEEAPLYINAYALHFLTEAKDRGYPVPPDLLSRGLDRLTTSLQGQTRDLNDLRARAYALYVLTRNGKVMTNEVIALRDAMDKNYGKAARTDAATIYMAAVHRMLKQEPEAAKLIAGLRLGDKQADDYRWYYDGLLRDATLLFVLSRHFPERLKALTGDDITQLTNPIMAGNYNSISSATVILALDGYATAVMKDRSLAASIQLFELRAKGDPVALPIPTGAGLFPRVPFSAEARKIRLTDSGKLALFYQTTEAGFDRQPPKSELRQHLEIQREYQDAEGHVITKTTIGAVVTVKLKIRATERGHYLTNLAIIDLLPGGTELILNSLDHRGGDWYTPEYIDKREDRIVIYGGASDAVKEFTYQIRAVNKGTFVIPPAQGESMYDRTIVARSMGGGTLTVE